MTRAVRAICRLPEDIGWDEERDEVVRPGGLPAALIVREMVQYLCFECTEPSADLDQYLWVFDATSGRTVHRVAVFHLGNKLVVIVDDHTPWSLFAWPGRAFRNFLQWVVEALAADERFEEVVFEEARATTNLGPWSL